MRGWILAVMWPRRDIVTYLKDGCTSADLKDVKNFKELNRSAIVDRSFDALSRRADGGLGQFRAMLRSLLDWSHFNPTKYDTLGKLNRKDAERLLNHLRAVPGIRDGKIKADRERRQTAKAQDVPTVVLSTLLNEFLDLYRERTKPQQRGLLFEGLLRRLAELEKLEVTSSFRSLGEQIDGGLKFDGENYLLEAKWHDKSASTEPLYAFAHKTNGKFYGRGVFVSINGFMPDPVLNLMPG